jgi:hypothetical protein
VILLAASCCQLTQEEMNKKLKRARSVPCFKLDTDNKQSDTKTAPEFKQQVDSGGCITVFRLLTEKQQGIN